MRRPVPGLSVAQQSSEVLEIMCAYGEARGEDALGVVAIVKVIRTRAKEKGVTSRDIVLAHSEKGTYAFTSFDPRDPNCGLLLLAWKSDPAGWARVDALVEIADSMPDPTCEANHYYNPDVSKPAWGRGSDDWHETWVHGHHVFGRCA